MCVDSTSRSRRSRTNRKKNIMMYVSQKTKNLSNLLLTSELEDRALQLKMSLFASLLSEEERNALRVVLGSPLPSVQVLTLDIVG
jgi:hypothetical protein